MAPSLAAILESSPGTRWELPANYLKIQTAIYIVMKNVIVKPCSMQHIFWVSVTHSSCAKICDWKFVSIELGFLGSGFWFYVWLLVAVTVCFLLLILHLYFNCNL
jgi:hypothetical protein